MFNDSIKAALMEWHNTKDDDKDYRKGLDLLVRASGNRNFLFSIHDPQSRKDFIDYNLTKYIKFVLADAQPQVMREMSDQVEKIVKENLSLSEEKDKADHRGRRDDHDDLPDNIKALYVENLDLLRRIRELHNSLRNLTIYMNRNGVTCRDSERYPFLKEIIKLDKKMHENWRIYDTFVPGSEQEKKKDQRAHEDETSDKEEDSTPEEE